MACEPTRGASYNEEKQNLESPKDINRNVPFPVLLFHILEDHGF